LNDKRTKQHTKPDDTLTAALTYSRLQFNSPCGQSTILSTLIWSLYSRVTTAAAAAAARTRTRSWKPIDATVSIQASVTRPVKRPCQPLRRQRRRNP